MKLLSTWKGFVSRMDNLDRNSRLVCETTSPTHSLTWTVCDVYAINIAPYISHWYRAWFMSKSLNVNMSQTLLLSEYKISTSFLIHIFCNIGIYFFYWLSYFFIDTCSFSLSLHIFLYWYTFTTLLLHIYCH